MRNADFSKGNGRQQESYPPGNGQRPPYTGARRPDPAENMGPSKPGTQQQIRLNQEPATNLPFVTAADLQPKPVPSSRNAPVFEPIQPRSGKTRLNLLNPMSLLARRRSAQNIAPLAPIGGSSFRAGMNSETFDPSIRGTVFHDFSAPRPRKTPSQSGGRSTETTFQRSPNPQQEDNRGNHTPVFTENFEENQYPAAGKHVRKASETDLPLPQPAYARGAVRKSVATDPDISRIGAQEQDDSTKKLDPEIPPPLPPKSDDRHRDEPRRISIDPDSLPKPASPSKSKPVRNVSKASSKDGPVSGLPNHMKSTSSRFSFDMIGAAEQERLLEERHRQKALERKAETPEGDEDPYDDDYDYDNMDDDDGLEERIPGVNADAEEEDIYGDDDQFAGFSFQPLSAISPATPYSAGVTSTPRDADGEVIGFALTKESPDMPLQSHQQINTSSFVNVDPSSAVSGGQTQVEGLGLQNITVNATPMDGSSEVRHISASNIPAIEEDDLYFDDGMIDTVEDIEESGEFDESIFDQIDTDRYGRPLKPIPLEPTLYSPPNIAPDPPPVNRKESSADRETSSSISPSTTNVGEGPAPQPSVAQNGFSNFSMIPPQPGPGLTQDTLAAYQSALAAAAFTAAANGKFRRDSSTSPHLQSSPSEQEDRHLDMATDSNDIHESYSPYDDFDYDDSFEDDTIIAAANAEALANDSDGFYGQEFGFYSAPGGGNAEYANGGFFGPRGTDGIIRSQSGRIVSREPNLTPITERSEYSNRNSFMSLNLHPVGQVTSPGLVQLAEMMGDEYDDGDMSLTALMKLRNRAWGGSQASLHSSNGSPISAAGEETSSPINGIPPWGQTGSINGQPNSGANHFRQESFGQDAVSPPSAPGTGVTSQNNSAPGSPTITLATLSLEQNKGVGFENTEVPEERSADTKRSISPVEPGNKDFQRHRYTASSESISYLKEDDPLTGERWILERRRTAESGEVELLEREVVSGGRI